MLYFAFRLIPKPCYFTENMLERYVGQNRSIVVFLRKRFFNFRKSSFLLYTYTHLSMFIIVRAVKFYKVILRIWRHLSFYSI